MGGFQHTILAAFIVCLTSFSCHKEESVIREFSQQVTNCSKEDRSQEIVLTSSPGKYSGAYEPLVFEIEKVEGFIENSGWHLLNCRSQVINAMELENGENWIIAKNAGVQNQLITKIRLTFGDRNYVNADGSFSSSISELIILDDHQVIVHVLPKSTDQALILNLDLEASIIQQDAQFFFKPFIYFIGSSNTAVRGSIMGLEQARIIISSDTYSYSTFLSPTQEFMIQGIEEGVYELYVVPIAQDQVSSNDKIIRNVAIVKGKITTVQEIKF